MVIGDRVEVVLKGRIVEIKIAKTMDKEFVRYVVDPDDKMGSFCLLTEQFIKKESENEI